MHILPLMNDILDSILFDSVSYEDSEESEQFKLKICLKHDSTHMILFVFLVFNLENAKTRVYASAKSANMRFMNFKKDLAIRMLKLTLPSTPLTKVICL